MVLRIGQVVVDFRCGRLMQRQSEGDGAPRPITNSVHQYQKYMAFLTSTHR
jgi:hypothetical protein